MNLRDMEGLENTSIMAVLYQADAGIRAATMFKT